MRLPSKRFLRLNRWDWLYDRCRNSPPLWKLPPEGVYATLNLDESSRPNLSSIKQVGVICKYLVFQTLQCCAYLSFEPKSDNFLYWYIMIQGSIQSPINWFTTASETTVVNQYASLWWRKGPKGEELLDLIKYILQPGVKEAIPREVKRKGRQWMGLLVCMAPIYWVIYFNSNLAQNKQLDLA